MESGYNPVKNCLTPSSADPIYPTCSYLNVTSEALVWRTLSLQPTFQRKTKGQQLKGKIVSALFQGSQQQQVTCMVASSTAFGCFWSEWLWVWEGTRGRKINPVLGDGFLGNAPAQKTDHAEIRNPQKKEKRKGQNGKRP